MGNKTSNINNKLNMLKNNVSSKNRKLSDIISVIDFNLSKFFVTNKLCEIITNEIF